MAQRQNEEIRELTEASIAQGEEVKKISASAAILFAPTLVGTVYGMNFDAMPELHLAPGVPVRAAGDDRGQRRPVRRLQAPRLDLAPHLSGLIIGFVHRVTPSPGASSCTESMIAAGTGSSTDLVFAGRREVGDGG